MPAEVCADSVLSVLAAREAGAARVELCSGLMEGGLTPSCGLVFSVMAKIRDEQRQALAPGGDPLFPVRVLIRPRGGDFCYSEDEIEAMIHDIQTLAQYKIDGVVIGALTPEGDLDCPTMSRFLKVVEELKLNCTFHRAIDMSRDPVKLLEDLIELSHGLIDTVLTSGAASSALEGAPMIRRLVSAAGQRLEVMAGGGVTESNVERILEQTKVPWVHCSARIGVQPVMKFQRSGVNMGGALHPPEFARKVASQSRIESIRLAVDDRAEPSEL